MRLVFLFAGMAVSSVAFADSHSDEESDSASDSGSDSGAESDTGVPDVSNVTNLAGFTGAVSMCSAVGSNGALWLGALAPLMLIRRQR